MKAFIAVTIHIRYMTNDEIREAVANLENDYPGLAEVSLKEFFALQFLGGC